MKSLKLFILACAALLSGIQVNAFCGFYVARADAKLFNNKSEVILVRNGDKTTVTMSNDFQGDVKDFAMVVPVPTVLKENDIKVVDKSIFEKLNEYSAPRLVEYYDSPPCPVEIVTEDYEVSVMLDQNWPTSANLTMSVADEFNYRVNVEARYEVGEYEILILSAEESDGLRRWLTDHDYKIPENADEVLDPYIKSNMKFFVVKVNLHKLSGSAFEELSPIQLTYNSDRFMLPIRLGMANAKGPQDMIVYTFTNQGRVECTNYRTVELPSNRNIPLFVEPQFGDFYKALYEKSWKQEGRNSVFLEYAWDVSPQQSVKCDPCVGPPPIANDLVKAGVDWLKNGWQGTAYFTRMHVRYERDKFPQDLQFQTTTNKERYQCRYILTHPASGDMSCEEGQKYLKELEQRRKRELDELAALTGWGVKNGNSYIKEFNNRLEDYEFSPVMTQEEDRGGIWTLLLSFLGISTLIMVIARAGKKRKLQSLPA
ncbi:MAG: DUF2330 domain-containing protein [Flavobacteriales bacterium]|nr:DUF2330 domain-containing protein [Flavobacteriales bacterium]